MPKFRLCAVVGVSAYTVVSAATLEDAIEEAEGRDVVLGGLHTGANPTEEWVIEDADGTPNDIHEI